MADWRRAPNSRMSLLARCLIAFGVLSRADRSFAPAGAAARTAPARALSTPRPSCPASWSRCATSARTISSAGAIDGYEQPLCLLTRPAAAALAQVARDLEPRGLVLKVFDCYRPVRAVRALRALGAQRRRHRAQGRVLSRRRQARSVPAWLHRGASGHSRGSTIDLTLARRDDGTRARHGHAVRLLQPAVVAVRPAREREPRRPTAHCWRRRCGAAGFMAYNKEWWHFTLRTEPYPQTYFDFPVR